MAGTEVFLPPAPRNIELDQEEEIEVPAPLPLEEKVKPSGFQRFMPFIMMGMMALMMVLMFAMRSASGGGFNPMMMMMPLMMGMSMMMMFVNNSGGGNIGELNKNRKDYIYQLRELRKQTHKAGKQVHDTMCRMFPNPAILVNYIGNYNTKEPVMWQSSENTPGGITAFEGTVDEVSFRPFMSARLGTGVTNLIPNLSFEPLNVPETLEPVTTNQFRSFVRTQGFVPNVPIGVNLETAPAFAFTCDPGDEDRKYGLIRAMMASLAFNHSPNVIRFAVITDNIEDPRWEFMKWLPHALHPSAVDRLGSSRMVYQSIVEFANKVPEAVGDPTQGRPQWVVIVDKPNHEVIAPQRTSLSAGSNSIFIVAAAGEDRLATSKSARYHVTEDNEILLPYSEAKLNADFMSLEDMDTFARTMFFYRPPELAELGDDGSGVDTSFKRRNWLEVLGIDDINEWDPKRAWAANDDKDHLITPLGYKTINRQSSKLSTELLLLDAAESAAGGTGPHGVGQGRSGTGKSIMIAAFVLGLVARYSADKVNFLLWDFKGGSTFQRYENLPHVVMSLTNLADGADLLDRAYLVIEGEIQRRQELLDDWEVKDIRDYHKARKSNPDMPALPHLFLVADEFAEFIKSNREYMKLFESIARVGRSLGMHLFLVSQTVDSSILGDVEDQIGFGISLTVKSAGASRGVVGTDEAINLPSGKGQALAYFREGETDEPLSRFQTFFAEEIYVPPVTDSHSFDSTSLADTILDQDQEPDESVHILPYTVSPLDNVIDEPTGPSPEEIEAERKREEAARREEQAKLDDSKDMQMKNVLIDRIAREPNVPQALELWKRSMREPITYHDVALSDRSASYPDMTATLGVLDDPYHHDQYAWEIQFSNPRLTNLILAGARGSGKTVAMETIISSIAQTYPPEAAQFLIISTGAKIKEVEAYPHVVGYTAARDVDAKERFIGEVSRIIDIRSRKMMEWASPDAASYLSQKLENPVEGDPYGHLFLVVDGMGEMIMENKNEDMTSVYQRPLDKEMQALANNAAGVGVHILMTTVKVSDMGYSFPSSVPFGLFLSMDDPSEAPKDIRPLISAIRSDQPGRSADRGLNSRVLVPQSEPIVPEIVRGVEVFDPQRNYGADVTALAKRVAENYEQAGMRGLPEVKPVPERLAYAKWWKAVSARFGDDSMVRMPLGFRTKDATLLDVATCGAASSNLLVFGNSKSGKTNVLRVALSNIVQQTKPSQAKFVIFDPRNDLFVESQVLKYQNRLLKYATTLGELDKVFDQLTKELEKRRPSSDDLMKYTADEVANRAWIEGPDIYLLIDNLTDLEKTVGYGESPLTRFAEAFGAYTDLGVHIYATLKSSDAMGVDRSKLGEKLMGAGSPVLLLSGDNADGKVQGIRFANSRPGLGTFGDTNSAERVQVPLVQPWTQDMVEQTKKQRAEREARRRARGN